MKFFYIGFFSTAITNVYFTNRELNKLKKAWKEVSQMKNLKN